MRYEYQCPIESCGATKEVDHSMKKNPRVKCPQCGERMKRQIFAPRFVLKGPISDWPSKRVKWNGEQTQKNKDAERRMRMNRDPIPQQYAVVDADEFDAWNQAQGGKGIDENLLVSATEAEKEQAKQVKSSKEVAKTPKVKGKRYKDNEHGPTGRVRTKAGKPKDRKKLITQT